MLRVGVKSKDQNAPGARLLFKVQCESVGISTITSQSPRNDGRIPYSTRLYSTAVCNSGLLAKIRYVTSEDILTASSVMLHENDTPLTLLDSTTSNGVRYPGAWCKRRVL